LLTNAAQYADKKTHEEVITIALQTFIEIHQRRELRGKIKINPDYDYKTMRKDMV
jgi:hypothetical protein